MSVEDVPVCKAITVNHIAISVSDLRRSSEWYSQTFGLRVIQESEQSVLLGFGESMLVLRRDANPGTITHFMFGLEHFDPAGLKARLREQGLDPQRDSDSFHVRDPDGLNVQVGDRGLGLATGHSDIYIFRRIRSITRRADPDAYAGWHKSLPRFSIRIFS